MGIAPEEMTRRGLFAAGVLFKYSLGACSNGDGYELLSHYVVHDDVRLNRRMRRVLNGGLVLSPSLHSRVSLNQLSRQ